jgi:hypothetical protein
MFDQAVEASEAVRESTGLTSGALIPALCGCLSCGTVQMIAAPVLGVCSECGADLKPISVDQLSTGAALSQAA